MSPLARAKRAVLWDLDSTLANTTHRQDMVPLIKAGDGPTWVDYSLACGDDTPIEGAAALVRLLWGRIHQYGVSGRSMSAEQATQQWLEKHEIPLDGLFLRADDDKTPNGEHKVRVIRDLRDQGVDIVLFVEDWKETGDYIHEQTGVPVLYVQGEYAVEGHPV